MHTYLCIYIYRYECDLYINCWRMTCVYSARLSPPCQASVIDDMEVLKDAEELGLRTRLENLASRPDVRKQETTN